MNLKPLVIYLAVSILAQLIMVSGSIERNILFHQEIYTRCFAVTRYADGKFYVRFSGPLLAFALDGIDCGSQPLPNDNCIRYIDSKFTLASVYNKMSILTMIEGNHMVEITFTRHAHVVNCDSTSKFMSFVLDAPLQSIAFFEQHLSVISLEPVFACSLTSVSFKNSGELAESAEYIYQNSISYQQIPSCHFMSMIQVPKETVIRPVMMMMLILPDGNSSAVTFTCADFLHPEKTQNSIHQQIVDPFLMIDNNQKFNLEGKSYSAPPPLIKRGVHSDLNSLNSNSIKKQNPYENFAVKSPLNLQNNGIESMLQSPSRKAYFKNFEVSSFKPFKPEELIQSSMPQNIYEIDQKENYCHQKKNSKSSFDSNFNIPKQQHVGIAKQIHDSMQHPNIYNFKEKSQESRVDDKNLDILHNSLQKMNNHYSTHKKSKLPFTIHAKVPRKIGKYLIKRENKRIDYCKSSMHPLYMAMKAKRIKHSLNSRAAPNNVLVPPINVPKVDSRKESFETQKVRSIEIV